MCSVEQTAVGCAYTQAAIQSCTEMLGWTVVTLGAGIHVHVHPGVRRWKLSNRG